MTCYDTNGAKGIHIGTSAEFETFESEEAYKVFLCLGGSNDSSNYDPATHLYAGAVFSPGVSQPNIKVYLGGGGIYEEELRKTYNINPDHVAAFTGIWQTNPGWSAKVRFDFCDGDEVIYSRTTWWGTKPDKPKEPEPVPDDICQSDLIAIGAGATLHDFYYQPVQLGAGDSPTKCTIKIVDPWEGEAGHNDIFNVGETKTYPNPDNEDEIYTLTLDGIFKGDERLAVDLTACYQSGIPPDCLTPVIESITVSPENPIVGEKVEVTVAMVEGGGTFHLLRCRCGNDTRLVPIHSNVSKCTYWESGDYTIECSIVNTCGNHSEWVSVDITVSEPAIPPTITALTWSPTGDFHCIGTGSTLLGTGTELKLISTNPDDPPEPHLEDGEALMQIDSEDPFVVAEGDHFRFNDMEWWILNIVCGPECAFITLADEYAESARIPKVGDTVEFQANIDWHGEEIGTIKWYYAKSGNKCFMGEPDWTLFASGSDMVSYLFDNDDDNEIVFLKVVATNKDGEVGVFGNACRPAFNLWSNLERDGLLEVQFSSGALYQYKRVPEELQKEFLEAPSKGKFFWQNIRHAYQYLRVR